MNAGFVKSGTRAFDRHATRVNIRLRWLSVSRIAKIFKKVEDVVLTAYRGTLCCSSRDTADPLISGLFSLARDEPAGSKKSSKKLKIVS